MLYGLNTALVSCTLKKKKKSHNELPRLNFSERNDNLPSVSHTQAMMLPSS